MSLRMSPAEADASISALSPQIDLYAELLVKKGAALRPGQELVVQAPVECADFARRVVRKAYEARAGHVTVIWSDDVMTRLEYENVALPYFEHTPSWKIEQLNSLAEKGASFLFLDGSDPAALQGIDPAKPAAASRARNLECRAFRDGMDFGRNVWCIAGVPVESWAVKVFPDTPRREALYRLWIAILQVARADGPDPQVAWETHNATFEKNKRLLNEGQFDALHYRSSNGTDLTIGLNPDHIWDGGSAKTVSGTVYFPNIPTEEIFTTPDRMRADGIVYSALPLVHQGQVVRDFWMRFEDGCVVDYDARQGREVLRHIIETDDNACRLGECALISKNTPIRETGLLFYNTLYDENASCHLALGMGFPECVKGGYDMSFEELVEHGVNRSHTHVDFMIGSDDLDVTGIREDGTEVPIFVDGQWAWEDEFSGHTW
jgi:aminopeptidase